ncbi:hypothetical protein C7S17_0659 [Burkholderia thailandensis]|nr:hypothetical protein [Burkholderia thailandensis]
MHGRSGDFGRPTIDRLGAHGKPHVRAAQVSTRRAKQGRCCNNRPETPYDFDQIYDSNGFFFESNPPPADRRPAIWPRRTLRCGVFHRVIHRRLECAAARRAPHAAPARLAGRAAGALECRLSKRRPRGRPPPSGETC